MNFAFSPEQDDLRREARAFLEANPTASIDQLRELGWVGMLGRGDTSTLRSSSRSSAARSTRARTW